MRKSRKSLLWEIDTDAGSSYLFGTMHVRDQSAYRFVEPVKPFISRCRVYAAEMDLRQAEESSTPEDILLPNTSIKGLLPPKKYAKLQKILLKAFGFNLNAFHHVQPIVIANLISEQVLSADHHLPLDRFLWQYALSEGLEMTGVESYAEQIHTMRRIRPSQQIKSLLAIGKHPQKFRRHIIAATDLYQAQEIHHLYKFTKKNLHAMKKILVYQRNYRMAAKINRMVKSQTHFIAIGAGHLSGKKGLIRLLKAHGRTLRPVALDVENQ